MQRELGVCTILDLVKVLVFHALKPGLWFRDWFLALKYAKCLENSF